MKTSEEVEHAMKAWRNDRGWWHCIDCGQKITDPHPSRPPYHYMCPVETGQRNVEWAR